MDTIISVGYRVNSKRGTQFRIWATQTLKELLVAQSDPANKDGMVKLIINLVNE